MTCDTKKCDALNWVGILRAGTCFCALLLGLLVSSSSLASETLELIEASSEESADGWENLTLSPTEMGPAELKTSDQLMGESVSLKDNNEEEKVIALPIPEPAAAAILLAGLGSMGWMRYRLG